MTPPVIDRITHALPDACYFAEPQRKDLIVLCASGSVAVEPTVANWKKKANLRAMPYVVDLDGAIYETFDPRGWTLHLNMPAHLNPAARNDRRSIAVSIINPGGLRPRACGKLAWWFDNFTKPWCAPDDTSRCLKSPFRSFDYFAAFTDAQYEALRSLLPWLCREHGIPWQMPAPTERLTADPRRFARFRGILAHHHFRPDHVGVGPAFDWDRLAPCSES